MVTSARASVTSQLVKLVIRHCGFHDRYRKQISASTVLLHIHEVTTGSEKFCRLIDATETEFKITIPRNPQDLGTAIATYVPNATALPVPLDSLLLRAAMMACQSHQTFESLYDDQRIIQAAATITLKDIAGFIEFQILHPTTTP